MPLIYPAVRKVATALYPEAVRWGSALDDHAGFKALWLQFDHILPNARGGATSLENMVVACAPCNYARMNYTLDEAGLLDPRTIAPEPLAGFGTWDGLVKLLSAKSVGNM
ncbi:HNH endonuclease [Sphingomonas sp. TDK1]|uniref:HNH endonuclease n=1 Tax=Sphingomonas sp. TDK1 TaxID=453247 RepID=UPI0018DB38C3|nr:HNH endonuclease [Sphingomonas sp. TDK1]